MSDCGWGVPCLDPQGLPSPCSMPRDVPLPVPRPEQVVLRKRIREIAETRIQNDK
jgi:hypothetical protein